MSAPWADLIAVAADFSITDFAFFIASKSIVLRRDERAMVAPLFFGAAFFCSVFDWVSVGIIVLRRFIVAGVDIDGVSGVCILFGTAVRSSESVIVNGKGVRRMYKKFALLFR